MVILLLLVRIVVFGLGAYLVFRACLSALRTFVLPRSAPDSFNRTTFMVVRQLFEWHSKRKSTYLERDKAMELYAPVALISLLVVWLFAINLGYIAMDWAIDVESWYDAFKISGSSLLTLGFALVDNFPTTILTFSEATIGLIMIALLIAYLPTIYSAFSRREAAVTMLEVRAGSPPSAVEMIKRYTRLKRLDRFGELWTTWEAWFVDLEESHTSLSALSFFRSPQPHRSWVVAAGAVLDSAALVRSAVDIPADSQADLCIRAGYLALRYIATFFRVSHNPEPSPTDSISISRAEFEDALEELAAAGVPLKADREQAWRDFAGWRVNYDTVLLALAELTIAPAARWSSDRRLSHAPVAVLRWRKGPRMIETHAWIPPSNT